MSIFDLEFKPSSDVADVFFIIHNKDGLAVSPWQIGSFGVANDICRVRCGREKDFKSRALTDCAVYLDKASVSFDNAQHSGQSKAGAFPDFLGGKERVEDFFHVLGQDAGAGVANSDADVRASFEFGVHPGKILIQKPVFNFHAQGAALGHGVAGINAKVEQNLVYLGGIALHNPQFLDSSKVHRYVSRKGLADEVVHVFDQMRQLNIYFLAT